MIKNLQFNEVATVVGGSFCPGLMRRLNNWVGKPLEKVGRETVRILDKVETVTGLTPVKEVKLTASMDGNGKMEAGVAVRPGF